MNNWFKGTVNVISSDHPWKDDNALLSDENMEDIVVFPGFLSVWFR